MKKMFYRINGGAWSALAQQSAHWWSVNWDSTAAKNGKQVLEIKAQDEAENVLCNKQRVFWINNQPGFKAPSLKVTLETDKKRYIISDKMKKLLLTVKVTDDQGNPVVDKPVDYAFYECRFWQSLHGTKNTDENGAILVEYYINETGIINIAAGATLKIGDYERRFGDLIAVEVEKVEKPKEPAVTKKPEKAEKTEKAE